MSTKVKPTTVLVVLGLAAVAVLGVDGWLNQPQQHRDETEISMSAVWGNGARDNAPRDAEIRWYATGNGNTRVFTVPAPARLGSPPGSWQKTVLVPHGGMVVVTVVPDPGQPHRACTITARLAGRVVATAESAPLAGGGNAVQCKMDPVP